MYGKRRDILTGAYEPTSEEIVPKAGTIDEEEEELSSKMKEVSIEIRKSLKTVYPEDVKGVPDFWLTIFRSTDLLSTMIQEHDEPVLKKLEDIRVVYADEMSYSLEFHFAENEYFSNPVLTKLYHLKSKVDADHPFGFEGPEIYKCSGCTIDWHKDKNLTVKTIKKKQKHKARGAVRTVNKQVPNDSFFNFFKPPEVHEGEDDDEDELDTQSILSSDFEIGHFLRARIVPKAVLYYTGDIVDDDDDDEFDVSVVGRLSVVCIYLFVTDFVCVHRKRKKRRRTMRRKRIRMRTLPHRRRSKTRVIITRAAVEIMVEQRPSKIRPSANNNRLTYAHTHTHTRSPRNIADGVHL